jgi:AcrR family transcriptional regulator
MSPDWRRTRRTFRHGNLAEALVAAALKRLEADGVEALSLRELARDAGVNHRAVYRHFPDKLSLVARVAEHGWQSMGRRIRLQMKGKAAGEPALIAGGVGFFLFAREHPNLFHLMAGPRVNVDGAFPTLETAMGGALIMLERAFIDAGAAPAVARLRTALFASALQGVTTQILHQRLRVSAREAKDFVADACGMLFRGLR